MKSIKSTFIRTLSLLLALIMVLCIPISAFAATVEAENYGISTAAYTYDSVREDTKRRKRSIITRQK